MGELTDAIERYKTVTVCSKCRTRKSWLDYGLCYECYKDTMSQRKERKHWAGGGSENTEEGTTWQTDSLAGIYKVGRKQRPKLAYDHSIPFSEVRKYHFAPYSKSEAKTIKKIARMELIRIKVKANKVKYINGYISDKNRTVYIHENSYQHFERMIKENNKDSSILKMGK